MVRLTKGMRCLRAASVAGPTWPQTSATDCTPHAPRQRDDSVEEDPEEMASTSGQPKHRLHSVFVARSSGVQAASDVTALVDSVALHHVGFAELCKVRSHSSWRHTLGCAWRGGRRA